MKELLEIVETTFNNIVTSSSGNIDELSEKTIYSLLTAITSGQGLGWERAMFFIREEENISGAMGKGLRKTEEIDQDWYSSSKLPLDKEMAIYIPKKLSLLSNAIEQISIGYFPKELEQIPQTLKQEIENAEIAMPYSGYALPLNCGKEKLGCIIVSNLNYYRNALEYDNKKQLEGIARIFSPHILINKQRKLLEEKAIMQTLGQVFEGFVHEIRQPIANIGPASKSETTLSRRIVLAETTKLEKLLQQYDKFLDVCQNKSAKTEEIKLNQLVEELGRKYNILTELGAIKNIHGDKNQVAAAIETLATHPENAIEIETKPYNKNHCLIRICHKIPLSQISEAITSMHTKNIGKNVFAIPGAVLLLERNHAQLEAEPVQENSALNIRFRQY